MEKYKGIRDPLHFLGLDCFSYGLIKGSIYKNCMRF